MGEQDSDTAILPVLDGVVAAAVADCDGIKYSSSTGGMFRAESSASSLISSRI